MKLWDIPLKSECYAKRGIADAEEDELASVIFNWNYLTTNNG